MVLSFFLTYFTTMKIKFNRNGKKENAEKAKTLTVNRKRHLPIKNLSSMSNSQLCFTLLSFRF